MTDQTTAPRPVPTLDELREIRAELATVISERDDYREARDVARQTADFYQAAIDRHRQELGAAGEVLAVVRDAAERIDRALATYDTTPGEEPEPDQDEDQAAVQNLLDESTRAFAAADTSSERVEVIRDLLAGWYARWPKTAVTDPHEPIAWQIASLISAAEAQASTPSSVPSRRTQEEPASEEVRWAYRWLDADGNVLDEMDTRDNVRETAEDRARRLAANRPPSIPRGDVVRYRVVTTAEVVATYPPEARP